jgi:addiction module HigA family antidote
MIMIDHYTVPTPGYYIKQELDVLSWTQTDLAFIIGCPVQGVNLIISGKRGITPSMAKALGSAFGVSAEFFVNLQSVFDLLHARDSDPGIVRRARLLAAYPVREMIRRQWIQDTDDPDLLEMQMMRFFETDALDKIPHLPTESTMTDPYVNLTLPQGGRQMDSPVLQALIDLEHLMSTLNDRQHAGLNITPAMWSLAYKQCSKAKAVIEAARRTGCPMSLSFWRQLTPRRRAADAP